MFHELEVEELKLGLTIRRVNDTLRNSVPTDEKIQILAIISCKTAQELVTWFIDAMGDIGSKSFSHIFANSFFCSLINLANDETASEAYKDETFISYFQDFLIIQFNANWGTTLEKGFEAVSIICQVVPSNTKFCEILCKPLKENRILSLSAVIQFFKSVQYMSEGQDSIKTMFLDSDICSFAVSNLFENLEKVVDNYIDDYFQLFEQAFSAIRVLATNHEGVRLRLASADFADILSRTLNFLFEYHLESGNKKSESLKPSSGPDINKIMTHGLHALRQAINGVDRTVIHRYVQAELKTEFLGKVLKEFAFQSDELIVVCLRVVRNLANGNQDLKRFEYKLASETVTVFQKLMDSEEKKMNILLEACIAIRNLSVGCASNKEQMTNHQDQQINLFFVLKDFLQNFLILRTFIKEGLMLLQSLLLVRSNIRSAQSAQIPENVAIVKNNYINDDEIKDLCDSVMTLADRSNFPDKYDYSPEDKKILDLNEKLTEQQKSLIRSPFKEVISCSEEKAGIELEKLYAPEKSDTPDVISMDKDDSWRKVEIPAVSQSNTSTFSGQLAGLFSRLTLDSSSSVDPSQGGSVVPLLASSDVVEGVGQELTVWVITNRERNRDGSFSCQRANLQSFFLLEYKGSNPSDMTERN